MKTMDDAAGEERTAAGNPSNKGAVRIYFNPFRYPPHVPVRIKWRGNTKADDSLVEVLKPLNSDVVEMESGEYRIVKRKNARGIAYVDDGGSLSLVHGQVPYRLTVSGKPSTEARNTFRVVHFPIEQQETGDLFTVTLDKPFAQKGTLDREVEMVKWFHRLPERTPEAASEEVAAYMKVFEEEAAADKLIDVRGFKGLKDIDTREERYDLRHRTVYTIDSETTKDIDDAVEVLQLAENRYLLGVHIADVTAFVKEGSPRDQDARDRGTSHYLADRVIHMLPQCLSQLWCSLNPLEDRLAFSVYAEVEVTGDGAFIRGVRFAKSLIRSKARLTYRQVDRLLEGDGLDGNDPVHASLKHAADLARVIEGHSSYHDLSLASTNIKYGLDPKGVLEREVVSRSASDILVEMFMITANRLVGEKIADVVHATGVEPRGIGVYRVQAAPFEGDLRDYLQKLKRVGLISGEFDLEAVRDEVVLALESDEELLKILSDEERDAFIRSAVYRRIVQERIDDDPISLIRLGVVDRFGYKPGRILSRAGLSGSPGRSYHHGLGINRYLWFTSPIRRYPDMVNHRQLKAILEDNRVVATTVDVNALAQRLNNAKNAENALHRRLLMYYLCQKEGLWECDTLVVRIASFQWRDPRSFVLEGIWKEMYPLVFSFRKKVFARIGDYGLSCQLGSQELRVGEEITISIADPLKDISPHKGTITIGPKSINTEEVRSRSRTRAGKSQGGKRR